MISAVTQGSRGRFAPRFQPNLVPFSRVYYTTDANSQGDRLVVGELAGDAQGLAQLAQQLPSSRPEVPNQQFCDQVQLAPGLYVNAYVPTAEELTGKFPDFQGLLVDPNTNLPYPREEIIPHRRSRSGFRVAHLHCPGPHHPDAREHAGVHVRQHHRSRFTAMWRKATHGQTVGEILGDGDGSQAFQSFALHQTPLTLCSGADAGRCAEHPGRTRQRNRVGRSGRPRQSRID